MISRAENDGEPTNRDGGTFESDQDKTDDFEKQQNKEGLDMRISEKTAAQTHALQLSLPNSLKAAGCRTEVDAPLRII
ncbi:unnamed protein product [Toxocara canis]|uniref:Uncharacterized protein n=1 Tax=Toxocara canis TaxID=6265 RepID=A0A183UQT4_TOXCA|nr:unnamed protein product [Toxocara canis]